MKYFFDSGKKSDKFLNLLFWLPFLILEAGDNCGDEYNKECCLFATLGTVLPVITFFLSVKFDWKILILEKDTLNVFFAFNLGGWFLGIIYFLAVYLLVGLFSQLVIKSHWDMGIF
ncbi:MAG: hypothetical protein V3574_04875 [Candidatus Moraniibacteriota bacterium]